MLICKRSGGKNLLHRRASGTSGFSKGLMLVMVAVFWGWPFYLSGAGRAQDAQDKTVVLAIKVLDENGNPTGARIRLRGAHGEPQQVRAADAGSYVLIHPAYPQLGVAVPSQARIVIPAGRSTVRVERGTEYRRVELPLEAQPGDVLERTVRLERWVNMEQKGWWSADMHVHRDPWDMPALMEASDLHFAPTVTVWNDTAILKNWPEQTAYSVGRNRVYSLNNSEDERDWGAVLFLDLKRTYDLPGKRYFPPATVTWQGARDRGAFIDLEKPIWWEAPVVVALVRPDSIGVAVNQFLEEGMLAIDIWDGGGGRRRDPVKYHGDEGWANYIYDLYYHYLSAGFRIGASGGSANGVLRNPPGYNRSYVYLPGGFSHEAWWEGQKAGRNFVTNGPMLFLTVNGQMPGAILPGADEVSVKLEAISADELDRVEIIADGVVSQTFRPQRDKSSLAISTRVKVRRGGWVVARCFEKNPLTVRFAQTSPVYIGDTAFRSEVALTFFRTWIDDEIKRIQTFPSDAITENERSELIAICRKARKVYE